MPNAIPKANAQTLPKATNRRRRPVREDSATQTSVPSSAEVEAGPSDWHTHTLEERSRYAAAYGKWLQAVAHLDGEGNDDDVVLDKMCTDEEEAAAAFLGVHPPLRWMLFYKFDVLERVMENEDRAGLRDRGREIQTLAAIKSDLLFLGFDSP
jgi:hypothetical protein